MAIEEVVMAKVRRNGPCPCGSGSKAKRCCHGTHEAVGYIPAELCDLVVPDLKGASEDEMHSLFDDLLYLPEIDMSLQARLGILTPDMHEAIRALEEDDDYEFDAVLGKVVADIDSPNRRIELARAVIALRDQGRIPPQLAAIAVLELDRKDSILFLSAVAESLAVLAGDQTTPSGLLIASR